MKILLLSPHTDDVELGAGGSLIKMIENENEIRWVVFSTAEDSIPSHLPNNTLLKEFTNVADSLNLKKEYRKIFNFKVRAFPKYRQDILEKLIQIKKEFTPELVIGPSLNDYHQDHCVVANEMIRAFKTDASIIGYELPTNHTMFNTTLFIKLDERHIKKKIELLQKYKSQFIKERAYFSKEYIFGLAKVRGVQCDANYAEAFEVIKWII